MRDDGAEDTGEVAACEGDAGLGGLGVVGFFAGEVAVDGFDDGFEGGELHHGVGDLAAPKGVEAFVEAADRRGWLGLAAMGRTGAVKGGTRERESGEKREAKWANGETYPATPSLPVMTERPENVPLAKGGMVVCMRTLTASKGQRARSAMNSAEALAARYSEVLYLYARSSPARSE